MAHETRNPQSGGPTIQASRPVPPAPPYGGPVRTSTPNRKLGLGLIAAFLAVGGLVTGLAVANKPSTPAAASAGSRLLGTISGTGVQGSTPFTVPSGTVTARYAFACPAGSHGFGAALVNSTVREVDVIANTTATSGRQTVTLHPKHPGAIYRIGATSPCPYRVNLYTP